MIKPDDVVQASPGAKFIYHEGALAKDRERDPLVDALAQSMMRLAQRGYVFLLQKRLGNRRFQYLAVRRRRVA